jgi:two-component system, chemotaxis family, response regulator Rcp1
MRTGPIQILLVEDNPADIRLTQEALRDAKMANELHAVVDGEQALAYLRHEHPYETRPNPDLVLLDLNLPRKDGREVLAEMKSDAELRRIPVAILTTSSAESDVLRSYDLGANCYLTKPVDFNEFLKVVVAIDEFWLSLVRLPGRAELINGRTSRT